eukprot:9230547-Pyramimonas_sp.AAC.1
MDCRRDSLEGYSGIPKTGATVREDRPAGSPVRVAVAVPRTLTDARRRRLGSHFPDLGSSEPSTNNQG